MWLNKDYLRKKGVYSICTSNSFVIETSLEYAEENDDYILIEVTPHQVNQYGGYSGMTPEDFKNFVHRLLKEKNIKEERVILGGDHLGPLPWQEEKASSAMKKAKDLVKLFVESGYKKIHLDCSMPLGDDPPILNMETIAEREKELLEVAENAAERLNIKPVYVVGTDVPVAGGGEKEGITSIDEFKKSLSAFKKSFQNFPHIWDRIIGFVVMLGIGFDNDKVFDYDRKKVINLLNKVREEDLFIEAHSTDYQTKIHLKKMVEDGIRILKVGPALTASFRRTLFILNLIENELIPKEKRSNLKEIVLHVMKKNDKYWSKYYKEENTDKDILYSLLDRIRYYWEFPEIKRSLQILLKNLSENIDMRFIYQYFYDEYYLIREGKIKNKVTDIIKHEIKKTLEDYHYAIHI
uniref:Tagatose-6-phosphate kinase n=1 Tax=Dictyoglomus thermophilum TaxID=14 RepID=A0A7C3RX82_DICTH